VIRRCTGNTATDLVCGLRLDRAAADLRLSDAPVATIASAVGLPNLGYFYHCFHARFGTTPDRYRRAARQAM
jgi:transcriptional regulator GlxA family with amidase domain